MLCISTFRSARFVVPTAHLLCMHCSTGYIVLSLCRVPEQLGEAQVYRDGVIKELRFYQPQLSQKLRSVYFGGGTPSRTPEIIQSCLDVVREKNEIDCEITSEANPTDLHNYHLLVQSGVNRLSIGVQCVPTPFVVLMVLIV